MFFYLNSVWLLLYAWILQWDEPLSKWFLSWIFVMVSFVLGTFVLFPYLIVREPRIAIRNNSKSILIWFGTQGYSLIILIFSVLIVGWAIRQLDWEEFIRL